MNNDFNEAFWSTVKASSHLQETLLNSFKNHNIPTRPFNKDTGLPEDIRDTIPQEAIEDPTQREAIKKAIETAENMTVRELALRLEEVSTYMLIKEREKGDPLTDVEKTLRDIDVISLALTALSAPRVIGRKKPIK